MTETCCLDCATEPCPVGPNCRDSEYMRRAMADCHRLSGEGDIECMGRCEHFKKKEQAEVKVEASD